MVLDSKTRFLNFLFIAISCSYIQSTGIILVNNTRELVQVCLPSTIELHKIVYHDQCSINPGEQKAFDILTQYHQIVIGDHRYRFDNVFLVNALGGHDEHHDEQYACSIRIQVREDIVGALKKSESEKRLSCSTDRVQPLAVLAALVVKKKLPLSFAVIRDDGIEIKQNAVPLG